MCSEWRQTRPCITDRSVGHVSTGWIMLQSLHCMHCMQLCVTFLPSSHYCHAVTLDIEQHTLSWRRPCVTGHWMLLLYAIAIAMTQRCGGEVTHCCLMISQVSSQFQENMISAKSHRWFLWHWKHVSGWGICEIPRESPLLCVVEV